MKNVPLPDNEAARLAAVRMYKDLDKAASRIIRDLLSRVAAVCDTPVALIGYVEEERVLFFEKLGTSLEEIPRNDSISAYVILQDEPLVIPDLSLDPRFADHPVVTEKSFRFYAAAPLITHEGYAIGDLCILDRRPRELSAGQIGTLKRARFTIMKLLEFQHLRMDITASETQLSLLDSAPDAMVMANADGEIIFVNQQTRTLFGYADQELIGEKIEILIPERFRSRHRQSYRPAYLKTPGIRPMGSTNVELYGQRKDGSEFPVEVSLSPIHTDDGFIYIASAIRDITERKRNQDALVSIASGVSSSTTGEEFFLNLALHLAAALNADYAIIGELKEDNDRQVVETIALVADGKLQKNITYDLKDTPCEIAVSQSFCTHPNGIQKIFPRDFLLQEMGVEGYAGALLTDSKGTKLGIVNVLFRQAMEEIKATEFLLQITASRASAEMLRIRAEHARNASEQLFYKSFHSSPDAMTIADLEEGRFVEVNESMVRVTGFTREEVIGYTSLELKLLDAEQRHWLVDQLQRMGTVHQMDLNLRMKSGELRQFQTSAEIIEHYGKQHIFSVHRDVTESQRLSQQLMHLASHDPLTGLPNRREFEIRLRRLAAKSKEEGSEHALCYLDLDQFKIVNDTCGHIAGDELLRQISVLIHNKIRQRDTLARLGGDEFGILIEQCNQEQAFHIVDEVRRAIESFRFTWDKKIFSLGVSSGLVIIDKNTTNITELLKAADVACYVAKQEGRNRVHIYKEDDQKLALHQGEIQWVSRINESLLNNRLSLVFQPILPLSEESSDEICYEALLRMRGEENESILPGAFLPSAERFGLSTQIDRWVIKRVINMYAQYSEFFPRISMLSINLCGSSLVEEDFLEFIKKILTRNSGIAGKICFEITETEAIANLSKATKFINTLKALGCRFALDDFGSGLSSFAYLKNLSVDYLKIDGIFIRDILVDKLSLGIVKSVIEIGKQVGIKTIAEYIENEATLKMLTDLKVDFGQGFYIGKPEALELTPVQPLYQAGS